MKHVLLSFLVSLSTAGLAFAELTTEQKAVLLETPPGDKSLAKIVLIAGVPSNKPGQHEYFAGCALMMNWLRQAPGVWPVLCAEGWPKDESVLDGASCLVMFMDGGAKLSFLEPARWAKVKSLMDAGTGLVAFHQAVEVPADKAAEYQTWLGAVWQPDIGFRGHWDVKFAKPGAHAIMSGVRPFELLKDGWLCNLHFANAGVTPLLASPTPDKSRGTPDAKAHAGREEVVAWAFERQGGGRSFGFTGCDLHANWADKNQRLLVLNGILWAAKREVPAGGFASSASEADLARNWDQKGLRITKRAN